MNPVILARSLGWFSLGIGLTELVGGESLNRWLGVRGRASAALVAVAGITLLDLLCAWELSRRPL